MSSGVSASQECLDAFQSLKLRKAAKYIIYKLSADNTQIVVEKSGTSAEYEDFIKELPEFECRYAVYDLQFEKEGAGVRNKIIFVAWSPDDAKIKNKMLYASSKDALRKALVGIAAEIQGTDYSEVDYETVLGRVSGGA